jgi:hypothetical protein
MIDATTNADLLASLIATLPDGPLKERAAALKAMKLHDAARSTPKPSAPWLMSCGPPKPGPFVSKDIPPM